MGESPGGAIESEEQFWSQLELLVAAPCESSNEIDDALRAYLALTGECKNEYLKSEYDHTRCCYKLLDSILFQANRDYVRRQMLACLLQEDDVDILHFSAGVLLYDGRTNENVFEIMQHEGVFPRLVEMIRDHVDDDAGLHRQLIQLLYEMSRVQRLTRDDLMTVDDSFILYLLQLIEELANDVDDPYHHPVLCALLVLNEQYMCLANAPSSSTNNPVTNRIIKMLSVHGPSYRTFGQSLILLLNRESMFSGQLLILKLLYLLFTTPPTYDYFYTNDLHVLVDVIIRNLFNLGSDNIDHGPMDDDSERDGHRALRHTYLRVLCPLLRNSQLARENSPYKREELRKLLYFLIHRSSAHFAPVDETVLRLVIRCKEIDWIREEGDEADTELERKLAEVAPTNSAVASKLLGISLDEASVSSLSVDEMAAKVTKERPSVPPSRRNRRKLNVNGAAAPLDGKGLVTSDSGHLLVPAVSVAVLGDDGTSPFADDQGLA